MNSDFIELLEYGDVVLADRGFDIADDMAVHGASLVIPSFTRGKKQLSLQEVECSQKITKVRIHVERVTGLLKNQYTILQGTLLVTNLKRKQDTETSFIDSINFMFYISQYVTQCCTTVGSPIVIVTLSAHYTIHILITYYCFT